VHSSTPPPPPLLVRRAIQVRHWRFSGVALRTLVVVADTDVALALESLGPETAKLDVGLGHAHVGEQQPRSEYWLCKHVKDGVADDF